jgi:hypothetical protein
MALARLQQVQAFAGRFEFPDGCPPIDLNRRESVVVELTKDKSPISWGHLSPHEPL